MNINQLPDDLWPPLLDGASIQCEFLALSFLITNLKNRRRQGLTNQELATEFKRFFTKYGQLPAAQRDLEKIAKLRGYHV